MSVIHLVGRSPVYINGRALLTATAYRLETSIVDGKRTAAGRIVFAVPESGPEVDFNALVAEPFAFLGRVGAVAWSLADSVADGPPVECRDCLVDGEWVSADADSGDVRIGFRFSSSNVHLLPGA